MTQAVNTGQLVDQVAERAGVPKAQAKKAVQAVFETIGERLAAGERIQLSGFGTFEVRERAERQGVNPKTREKMTIAASKVVGFRPSTALRGRIGASDGDNGAEDTP